MQCPDCGAGPVIPENCYDLQVHHGYGTRGGQMTNACLYYSGRKSCQPLLQQGTRKRYVNFLPTCELLAWALRQRERVLFIGTQFSILYTCYVSSLVSSLVVRPRKHYPSIVHLSSSGTFDLMLVRKLSHGTTADRPISR